MELSEALDFLGEVPWRINTFILDIQKEIWERGGGMGSIPTRLDVPMIEEEDYYNILERDEAIKLKAMEFEEGPEKSKKYKKSKFLEQVKRINRTNSNLHSLRCDFQLKIGIAEDFREDRIYFPQQVDFRGRVYPIPPHLNHIGSDQCRSLLLFDKKMPLGPEGLNWLKIHLCNLFGENKIPLEERINWVDDRMESVRDSVEMPLDGLRFWLDAEDPFQVRNECRDRKEYRTDHKTSPFIPFYFYRLLLPAKR